MPEQEARVDKDKDTLLPAGVPLILFLASYYGTSQVCYGTNSLIDAKFCSRNWECSC